MSPDKRRPSAGTEGQVSRGGRDDLKVHRGRDSRRERREQLFPDRPDTVDLLEQLDRRREAARRLPTLCDEYDHERHALPCHDPEAMTG